MCQPECPMIYIEYHTKPYFQPFIFKVSNIDDYHLIENISTIYMNIYCDIYEYMNIFLQLSPIAIKSKPKSFAILLVSEYTIPLDIVGEH